MRKNPTYIRKVFLIHFYLFAGTYANEKCIIKYPSCPFVCLSAWSLSSSNNRSEPNLEGSGDPAFFPKILFPALLLVPWFYSVLSGSTPTFPCFFFYQVASLQWNVLHQHSKRCVIFTCLSAKTHIAHQHLTSAAVFSELNELFWQLQLGFHYFLTVFIIFCSVDADLDFRRLFREQRCSSL